MKRSSAPADFPTPPANRSVAAWGGHSGQTLSESDMCDHLCDRLGPWTPTGVTSGAA